MSNALPFRLFDIELRARIALTPSLVRMVLGGDDIAQMASHGPDQRIKLLFPDADGRAATLAHGDDWYPRYRALDPSTRPPMRTYTVRALRRHQRELDVDFVLHGATGPASRWALQARPGDALQMVAPWLGAEPSGAEWQPPGQVREVLLVGDETALPAVAGILESLAAMTAPPRVQAFIELPCAADRDYARSIQLPDYIQLQWLARDGAAHGERLFAAVAACTLSAAATSAPVEEPLAAVDIEHDILWEQAQRPDDFYAWIAGEAGVVMRLRRHLLNERGLPRTAITFMGYWRQGRVLD